MRKNAMETGEEMKRIIRWIKRLLCRHEYAVYCCDLNSNPLDITRNIKIKCEKCGKVFLDKNYEISYSEMRRGYEMAQRFGNRYGIENGARRNREDAK